MRVLLSTIGSRGDVQPVMALASRLRECGEEVRVCAPPVLGLPGRRPSDGSVDDRTLWAKDADHWNGTWATP
jgi:hypothetical protein